MILKFSQPLTKQWNPLFVLKSQYDQYAIQVITDICKILFYYMRFSLYELIWEPILHVICLLIAIIVSHVFSGITLWLLFI